ncbi:aldehyde dehydrogenase family protein [Parapedobacter koreensis]|uniref:acyl-CoA reductase n=1 Tax=Parapedobacter koreensis TaxID=332977 RepID=UPI000B865E93|nr:acyl-CoA reductase [Parapedobacter koreensis]
MTKKQRIDAFALLGSYLLSDSQELHDAVESAGYYNAWFTLPNVYKALKNTALNLSAPQLGKWLDPYPFDGETDQTVGLVLAGNIPLVGFHDILCVLCAGFNVQLKPSTADLKLTTHVLDKLQEIEPRLANKITITDRLAGFDLVIATGSDNTARYFTYYFGKKPHIIRKNRNSVAILTGKETPDALVQLGSDIFDYFGLGCRSVSKLFVPKGYDISAFYAGIAPFADIADHYKYTNNYDYNKSIYLINGDPHYDNGFLLVKPDERTASPLATLYMEEYDNEDMLSAKLAATASQLQCVVSLEPLESPVPSVRFGQSQQPALDDYADGVNTLDFLAEHR